MRPAVVVMLVLCACGPAGTLSKVESDVFAKSCAQTSCHKGASSAGNLNLEGKTYAKLVGVAGTVQGEQADGRSGTRAERLETLKHSRSLLAGN